VRTPTLTNADTVGIVRKAGVVVCECVKFKGDELAGTECVWLGSWRSAVTFAWPVVPVSVCV
jgi:hypothetical protein